MIPCFYTFSKGILRFGHEILPLPLLPESPRLCQRIAFALLLHFFQGELQAERKAQTMHKQLARRITPVTAPHFFLGAMSAMSEPNPVPFTWSISVADLADAVASILVEAATAMHGDAPIELVAGQRRDTLRALANMNAN